MKLISKIIPSVKIFHSKMKAGAKIVLTWRFSHSNRVKNIWFTSAFKLVLFYAIFTLFSHVTNNFMSLNQLPTLNMMEINPVSIFMLIVNYICKLND